jgi:hypothetical protein
MLDFALKGFEGEEFLSCRMLIIFQAFVVEAANLAIPPKKINQTVTTTQ